MGILEKFLIHYRKSEIKDIIANIKTVKSAGFYSTIHKFQVPMRHKMSDTEYVKFLGKMKKDREEEIRMLEKFKAMV